MISLHEHAAYRNNYKLDIKTYVFYLLIKRSYIEPFLSDASHTPVFKSVITETLT